MMRRASAATGAAIANEGRAHRGEKATNARQDFGSLQLLLRIWDKVIGRSTQQAQ